MYPDVECSTPTDEELQQFMDYMEAGVLNEDRLEYEERRRNEQDQPCKRMNKTASMYFFRHHYLSMIQEEDDNENCLTPRNSFASSIYESITDGKDNWNHEGLSSSPRGSTLSSESETFQNEPVPPKRNAKHDWGSSNSLDSVNSILSDESSMLSRRSIEGNCDRGEASRSLSHILRQLPPPPKGPPSVTPPPSSDSRSEKVLVVGSDSVELCNKQDKGETTMLCGIEKVNSDSNSNDEMSEKQEKSSQSLFERQISDIIESTLLKRRQKNPTKKKLNNTVGKIRNLFKSNSNNHRSNKSDSISHLPDNSKVYPRSAPSSPSIKSRFFQRSTLTKISKSISESNIHVEKPPTIIDKFFLTKSLNTKIKLKRSKSLNDSSTVEVRFLKPRSTNPFENSDDSQDEINYESLKSKMQDSLDDKMMKKDLEERYVTPEQAKSKSQREEKRVLSIYENMMDIEMQPSVQKPFQKSEMVTISKEKDFQPISISELIAECEDYVRTEQFTRDLSTQIMKMYLKERSNHEGKNPFETDSEPEYAETLETHSNDNLSRFPESPVEDGDSMYENEDEMENQTSKHEESPVDSAYGSDKKKDIINNSSNNGMFRDNRSLSSCSDVSTPSTIKKAESMDYDSVMCEYESAMSDIEETMSHLTRRSRSLTPTFCPGLVGNTLESKIKSCQGSKQWGVASLDRNHRLKDSHYSTSAREDRHRMNIVAVFDELKDYLSESDLDRSLDYKIALRRKKNRTQSLKQNTSNYPNKMAGYDNYGPITPTLSRRSDSRERMKEYAESVLSLSNRQTRYGSEESTRSSTSSQSAPSTPVGLRRAQDTRNRRSPSIASEISTLLEPIPEESDYSYPYLGGGEGSLAYEKRIETLRKEKDAARQEFFKDLMPKNNQENLTTFLRIFGEDVTSSLKKKPNSLTQVGLYTTLPRNGIANFGCESLKRKKPLKSASLGSLLVGREDRNSDDAKKSQSKTLYILTQTQNEQQPITFTSSVRVQHKSVLPQTEVLQGNIKTDYFVPNQPPSGIYYARYWNPEEDNYDQRPLYGSNQFLKHEDGSQSNTIRQCSCRHLALTDPSSESFGLKKSFSTSSIEKKNEFIKSNPFHNKDESSNENLYYAFPVTLTDDDVVVVPPPRPPPPINYHPNQVFDSYSLPRGSSSNRFEPTQGLQKSASTSWVRESNLPKLRPFATPFDKYLAGSQFDPQKIS